MGKLLGGKSLGGDPFDASEFAQDFEPIQPRLQAHISLRQREPQATKRIS
jgi:hypothetical protein